MLSRAPSLERALASQHDVVFEDFAPGTRPSRKSTRKGSNRQKTDAKFRLTRAKKEVVPRKPPPARSGARKG